MRSHHYDKFVKNLFQGFVFLTLGIFFTFYSILGGIEKQNWYLWAAGIAVLINTGLFFIGSAFVHKVKSDFIRKQRPHKEEEYEEYTLEK